MANEYLRRTPTSTGNRRVWTWSFWVKLNDLSGNNWFLGNGDTSGGSATEDNLVWISSNGSLYSELRGTSSGAIQTTAGFRDSSSWYHIMQVVDTTKSEESDRFRYYVNGTLQRTTDASTYPTINQVLNTNGITYEQVLGRRGYADSNPIESYFFDWFLVDGQALTPDVFGFYKQGKGYISAGSTQATDFRPGQWVPKTPRVIKTEINRRGGFGVNGFYLPMNDSNNFGADFHGDPNSIITLNEKLPQPRVGVASTAAVGLGYTDALRADPYAANLVLALPFVSGGLSSGFGDYAPSIKGSGTAKTVVSTSATIANVSAASTSGLYYGSGASFSNSGIGISFASSSDFAFGTGDYTVECWIHRSNASSSSGTNALWSIGNVNSVGALSLFYENTAFLLRSRGTGDALYTDDFSLTSSNFSTQQWNHFAVCRKGTTVTLYVNGVAAGISTTSTRNVDANPFIVGSINPSGLYPFFGFMQDLRVYKGVAKYAGGFDVPRPYTPVGIATWRQVPDTTANNFATLNGTSIPSKYTLSNGNLTFVNSTTNWTGWLEGTVGFSTGKYYWETRIDVSTDYHHIGIVGVGITHFNSADAYRYGISYQTDGRYYAENNPTNHFQTGITQSKTVGDIVMLAVDVTNKRMWVGKNGTWFSGDPSNASSPPFDSTRGFNYAHYVPFYDSYGSSGLSINFGQNPTFSGNTTAGTFTDTNGKGLFKYQPPSGFLALCEDNLPTPAISDPGKHFKTVLYTGDGASSRSIVGVGFTPDLVWIKNRNTTDSHILQDSVRGAGYSLFSNATAAEGGNGGNLITSFNSDGFTVNPNYLAVTNATGSNGSGNGLVAWCWRAGAGTTSTNTNGSVTSVVSVNQDAGFSIVSYTGNSTSGAAVGHGLGKAPSFIILKSRGPTARSWGVYHKSIGNTGLVYLDLTNATNTASFHWNNTSPTSSFYTLGNGSVTNSSENYIAYCWAEIEGFSKFGSYVGNGNADGPFVYCGFKPAFVLFKNASSTYNWYIVDNVRSSVNPVSQTLAPNLSSIEDTAWTTNSFCDFLSNGFKMRGSNVSINENGSTFIFAAFAESPFQTANSK